MFSTAAAWCVVDRREERGGAFESTVDSMKQYLVEMDKRKWAKEIRHHELPDDLAEYLLFLAVDKAKSDCTISNEKTYWEGPPLTFTTTNQNPSALRHLFPEMSSHLMGNYIRLSTLANLLRPISLYKGKDEIRVEIVLDSRVWSKCIEKYDPNLKRTIGSKKVHRRIRYSNSAVTPGLQIADLAAGINRKYLLGSVQRNGYRLLQSNMLNALSLRTNH